MHKIILNYVQSIYHFDVRRNGVFNSDIGRCVQKQYERVGMSMTVDNELRIRLLRSYPYIIRRFKLHKWNSYQMFNAYRGQ